ncbi:hypothetical protein BGZ63DRAFT_419693 [Mariannaea sp. PMI_226]|nr:hypothetical protein BGZ63DRAFT_419693 [Mariannaea sp. PMI_226]
MESKTSPQLTIYRGPGGSPGRFVWSPFAVKLETRLRFDGVPYKVDTGSPRTAPRGKIPYIETSSGSRLGDSTLIIGRLIADGIASDLNGRLSPVQRAHDLAIRALLEDKVYFYNAREKWCDNFITMRSGALSAIPWPVQWLVGIIAQRAVSRTLYGQGTGRFSDEEILLLKEEVWTSINDLLSEVRSARSADEEPFWVLGGESPSEVDATLFGFVASALVCDAAPTTMRIVRSYPTVVEYADRIASKYFPDYERWEST